MPRSSPPPPTKRPPPQSDNPLPGQVKGPPSLRDWKVAGPRLPASMMATLKVMHEAHRRSAKSTISFADWFACQVRDKILTA